MTRPTSHSAEHGVRFFRVANQRENQRETGGKGLFHLANILTCMLVFSLVQWENWLWGFQIAWFLINACVAIAICLAVAPA
jgi:hypothetical protein